MREACVRYAERSSRVQEKGWDVAAVASRLAPVLGERIETFGDVTALFNDGEYDFVFEAPALDDPQLLVWKKVAEAHDAPEARRITKEYLARVRELLETGDLTDADSAAIKERVWPYADEVGRGDVLWPMRVALSGRERSRDPFEVAALVGADEAVRRLAFAESRLADASSQ